jgi:uncharacterized protein with PIN domain
MTGAEPVRPRKRDFLDVVAQLYQKPQPVALQRSTFRCPECAKPLPSVYYDQVEGGEQTPPWLLICARCYTELREVVLNDS